ncbi:MAG: hypothetical protein GWN64_18585, partial [Candidatus Thorarchaeota archaeon]|nr:hypothetical protein [Candidatus Thorarchaeota archaeon]
SRATVGPYHDEQGKQTFHGTFKALVDRYVRKFEAKFEERLDRAVGVPGEKDLYTRWFNKERTAEQLDEFGPDDLRDMASDDSMRWTRLNRGNGHAMAKEFWDLLLTNLTEQTFRELRQNPSADVVAEEFRNSPDLQEAFENANVLVEQVKIRDAIEHTVTNLLLGQTKRPLQSSAVGLLRYLQKIFNTSGDNGHQAVAMAYLVATLQSKADHYRRGVFEDVTDLEYDLRASRHQMQFGGNRAITAKHVNDAINLLWEYNREKQVFQLTGTGWLVLNSLKPFSKFKSFGPKISLGVTVHDKKFEPDAFTILPEIAEGDRKPGPIYGNELGPYAAGFAGLIADEQQMTKEDLMLSGLPDTQGLPELIDFNIVPYLPPTQWEFQVNRDSRIDDTIKFWLAEKEMDFVDKHNQTEIKEAREKPLEQTAIEEAMKQAKSL